MVTQIAEQATTFNEQEIQDLQSDLRGSLIQPDDEQYDQARTIYNAMIDKHPGLIARCETVADVIAAVNFARDHDLDLAIHGGGHNGAGLAVVDGGLVIDLSPMTGIRVDPDARTVRVQGGATWGEVDHATHAFGLAVPSGIISTTGVAGLTLCTMHLYPINGAVHKVDRNDTAFSFRDVTWSRVIVGVDEDPDNAGRITRWAREYWQALHPLSAGGGYVNFMMEEGQDRIRATYRDNYQRLVEVKNSYDPHNLFHINQNIKPDGS